MSSKPASIIINEPLLPHYKSRPPFHAVSGWPEGHPGTEEQRPGGGVAGRGAGFCSRRAVAAALESLNQRVS